MRKLLTMAWQHSAIALICLALTITPACSSQQSLAVVTDIGKFLPAITNVADAVCAFVPAAPVCATSVASVTASANILITALKDYYTAQANGAVPSGILAALSQAITTFEADAANILDAVHLVNPAFQSEVEALAAAAQVLLAVVEGLLPPTVAGTVTFKFAASAQPKGFTLVGWTTSYNAKVDACEKYMPRTVTLKHIHVHGLLIRILTLGFAK